LNDQPQAPDLQPTPSSPQVDNMASLGQRFAAFMLDGVFMVISMMFLMQYLGMTEFDPNKAQDAQAMQAEILAKVAALSNGQKLLLALFPYISFLVLHGYLLSRYGQTIGKRIMGIAIVTMDNRVPPVLQLIVQRYLIQWLAGRVPVVGGILRMVDILTIFRADKRCIHDHLAGTKVIDLRIPIVQGKPTSIIV
jgi:uncharacterized RDD family membrane protein YckC